MPALADTLPGAGAVLAGDFALVGESLVLLRALPGLFTCSPEPASTSALIAGARKEAGRMADRMLLLMLALDGDLVLPSGSGSSMAMKLVPVLGRDGEAFPLSPTGLPGAS